MSRNPVAIIAIKEARDNIRDRRTILTMVILPLIIIPILIIGFPFVISNVMMGEAISASPVTIIGAEHAPTLMSMLKSNELFEIIEADNATQALRDGDVSIILRIPDNFEADMLAGAEVIITIEYLSSDSSSQIAEEKLWGVVRAYRDSVVVERLEGLGLDEDILTPFSTQWWDSSTAQEQSGYWLGLMMPMLLGIWAANGGMYTAIDVTAGEKERGSLEALLATPPTRTQIVLGKFLAVLGMAMVSVMLALLALIISLQIGGGAAAIGPGAADVPVEISPSAYLLILLVCLLLTAMIAALEIAICTFARSFKEAQNYITPLTFVIIFPAVLTQFISVYDLTVEIFAVPVLNAIFVFKEVLVGIVDLSHIGMTVGTTLVYALICLFIAVRVFRREDVLFR